MQSGTCATQARTGNGSQEDFGSVTALSQCVFIVYLSWMDGWNNKIDEGERASNRRVALKRASIV